MARQSLIDSARTRQSLIYSARTRQSLIDSARTRQSLIDSARTTANSNITIFSDLFSKIFRRYTGEIFITLSLSRIYLTDGKPLWLDPKFSKIAIVEHLSEHLELKIFSISTSAVN